MYPEFSKVIKGTGLAVFFHGREHKRGIVNHFGALNVRKGNSGLGGSVRLSTKLTLELEISYPWESGAPA